MLLQPEIRLLTLTGPGGSGKTRLAVEVARQLLEPFCGAVWFVSLADLVDPEMMADYMLDALRLPHSPSVAPLEQVITMLSQQPTLVVIDNMEHLLRSDGVMEYWSDGVLEQKISIAPILHHSVTPTAVVRTLLERVPTLKLLVTSRQRLNVESEREFVVAPLPTPKSVDAESHPTTQPPEHLITFASVQLFVDRAQAVKPDFQITPHNASDIAELCERLDGIPLAIELAASRILALPPAQMVARLRDRFDFLVSRRRDLPERHRTMRAAIDWSYQLLSPELQRFFARLSVFRGGCTLEAAEQVCSQAIYCRPEGTRPDISGRYYEPDVLDFLAQLRDCSLVQTQYEGGRCASRCWRRCVSTPPNNSRPMSASRWRDGTWSISPQLPKPSRPALIRLPT